GGAGLGVLGAVGSLDGKLADTLQQGSRLVQRAFTGLQHADAVLGVLHALLEPADLGTQLLADAQAGGVVGSPVDAEAARQLLEAAGQVVLRFREMAISIHRLHVLIDAETHCFLLDRVSTPNPWESIWLLSVHMVVDKHPFGHPLRSLEGFAAERGPNVNDLSPPRYRRVTDGRVTVASALRDRGSARRVRPRCVRTGRDGRGR